MSDLSPRQRILVLVLVYALIAILVGMPIVWLIMFPEPATFIIVGSIAAFFCGMVLLHRWSRRRFLAGREPMSDEEFITLAGLDAEDHELGILVRQAMSDGYENLPREYLRPDDKVWKIADRTCMTPMDTFVMALTLEDHLGVEVTDEQCLEQLVPTKLYNRATVGELVHHIITVLRESGTIEEQGEHR